MKKILFAAVVLSVSVLAGCSTESAMSPSHIALLHSGSMIVAVPHRSYITLESPRHWSAGDIAEFSAGWFLFGIAGGSFVGGNIAANKQASKEIYTENLGPYVKQFWSLYPRQQFIDSAQSVARQVRWMGKDPAVSLYGKAGVPGSGEMAHLVQSGNAQAIVLVQCVLGFSKHMQALSASAWVEIYVRGKRRGLLIDSGHIEESTQLASTGPELKSYGYEGIAAGELNDRAARGARANVWFESDAKRYKVAMARDISKLKVALENYLNGRKSSD